MSKLLCIMHKKNKVLTFLHKEAALSTGFVLGEKINYAGNFCLYSECF